MCYKYIDISKYGDGKNNADNNLSYIIILLYADPDTDDD